MVRTPVVSALAVLLLAGGCVRQPTPGASTQPSGAVGGGAGGGGALPSGTIVAFAGPQVPAGWTLCDGRRTPDGQPTPDLRGRFVMGADPAAGDAGQSGGSPSHQHNATTGPAKGTSGADSDNDLSVAVSRHTHDLVVEPAEALPPYAKLVYIMKD